MLLSLEINDSFKYTQSTFQLSCLPLKIKTGDTDLIHNENLTAVHFSHTFSHQI